jgi:hypothetical protein
MAAHIPFVNSKSDCTILRNYYSDSETIRVSLESIRNIAAYLPDSTPVWIDPAVDAYHHILVTPWPIDITSRAPTDPDAQWPHEPDGKMKDSWKIDVWRRWERQFHVFPGYRLLTHNTYWRTGYEDQLTVFVNQVLDTCLQYSPSWITVPQLPLVNDGSRNRINRLLAEATGVWKAKTDSGIKLILPLIITSANLLTRKPTRDNKVKIAVECYGRARADGIWVVDTTLSDQSRNEKFPTRYSKLIEFHDGLNQALPKLAIKIGGPYWDINLVLWARRIVDFPAVSLGTAYTYYISCGRTSPGNIRLAIPPIRRWVAANNDLRGWLDTALRRLSPTDDVHKQLSEVARNFARLRNRAGATNQVARFYKEWFDKIEATPKEGRPLALYQDISSAFVLGRQLPRFPETVLPHVSERIREAGKVAEQLMLLCL